MPRISRRKPRSRLKSALLGCGIGCIGGLLILGIIAAFLFARLTAVPPEVAQSTASDSPPSQSSATEVPPPVEQQTEEIRQAIESNREVPVSLRLSEAQLNDMLAEQAGSQGPLYNPRVILRDQDLLLTGSTQWVGRTMCVTIALKPYASNGRLAFRVDGVRVGELALPGSIVARVQGEIDRAMASRGPVSDRVYVDDVAIYDGQLVLSGTTVPQ